MLAFSHIVTAHVCIESALLGSIIIVLLQDEGHSTAGRRYYGMEIHFNRACGLTTGKLYRLLRLNEQINFCSSHELEHQLASCCHRSHVFNRVRSWPRWDCKFRYDVVQDAVHVERQRGPAGGITDHTGREAGHLLR